MVVPERSENPPEGWGNRRSDPPLPDLRISALVQDREHNHSILSQEEINSIGEPLEVPSSDTEAHIGELQRESLDSGKKIAQLRREAIPPNPPSGPHTKERIP